MRMPNTESSASRFLRRGLALTIALLFGVMTLSLAYYVHDSSPAQELAASW